ncbi:MBL fold metallo-hydrolase [Saccharothrix deserti]|uniref:MBL fold metallo-hydrolase n=1 Tax=Saccharothrix deserti TaxID=2593674 RepID=UPI00131ED05D|nr:MBL fold metallo-hydrolase [Saccharothrix deserti]
MKVHHLNCGTMRPFGGRLVDGRGSYFHRAELVCHVVLLEADDGLILVDTGLGLDDLRDPKATLSAQYRHVSRPVLDERETALRQVEALGFSADDVRHIALTHLDVDHAGGLRDFPSARVHVLKEELDDSANPRYSPGQWRHADFVPHEPTGEEWFGFRGVRELRPDVLLVPLIGHTRGHTGVAIRVEDRWLLHAGDAYFFHGEMSAPPHIPSGLKYFQDRAETVRGLRLSNQDRLREVAGQVDVFCAHDPVELRQRQPHRV